jgi:hypothetical protein
MRIYLPPSIRGFNVRRKKIFSTWTDHLPFGYDLAEALRPELLVELGTHNGASFFIFCQSVLEHDIECLCYAVDTWEGDAHTDRYDDSVFRDVQKHAHENYRGFAYLMRMLFNDALRHFDDGSIGLLHIDGLHTYEAVREDFENWYPKVRPGGVVLFHDIRARIKDFGAWKYWQELESGHPQAFRFDHGFGLGVLRKPGPPLPEHPLMQLLFNGTPEDQQRLRQFYVYASEHLEARRQVERFKPKPPASTQDDQGQPTQN